MKIAIIEDDNVLTKKLSGLLNGSWTVDFFKSSTDFGRSKLTGYDVIISDQTLTPIEGRELLKILSKKTTAELLLMHDGSFKEEDINNKSIHGLIDKSDLSNILSALHYLDVKLRIQKLAFEEHKTFEDIPELKALLLNNI